MESMEYANDLQKKLSVWVESREGKLTTLNWIRNKGEEEWQKTSRNIV